MTQAGGIVVAGSRPFVRSLAGSFRQRRRVVVGITGELEPAFVLANASRGLLVFEYDGAGWLALLSRLGAARRAGLRILAVLPESREAEVEVLERAGVDAIVPWSEVAAEIVVSGADALLDEDRLEQTPPPLACAPPAPKKAEQRLAAPWDPCSHMAPLARVVRAAPAWRRVGAVIGSLAALAVLLGAALYGVAG